MMSNPSNALGTKSILDFKIYTSREREGNPSAAPQTKRIYGTTQSVYWVLITSEAEFVKDKNDSLRYRANRFFTNHIYKWKPYIQIPWNFYFLLISFFHCKQRLTKKLINILNNVPFYFLQLPSPLSFEREASLFLWNRMVTLASTAPDLAEALSSSQKTYSRPVPHRETLSWHHYC